MGNMTSRTLLQKFIDATATAGWGKLPKGTQGRAVFDKARRVVKKGTPQKVRTTLNDVYVLARGARNLSTPYAESLSLLCDVYESR